MDVKELIETLEKAERKDAKVYFRCTSCDRCNQVQNAYEHHNLIENDIVVFLEEEV